MARKLRRGAPFKSAIHALPTETLSDIFRLADAAGTPKSKRRPSALEADLAQLANSPLLVLSQVSSRWHDIAINTPTLWSNIEINGMPRGRTRCTQWALEKTLRLLSACLERSGEAPLSVSLTRRNGESPHPRIFHLLVQHSHRWETVSIMCSLAGVDTSGLRGRLPRLKTLTLTAPPETVDFLESVPSLDHLTVRITTPLVRSVALGAIVRRKQLRSFVCVGLSPTEIEAAISSLPELPVAATFYLGIGSFQPHQAMALCLPPVTAPISTLACLAVRKFYHHHTSSAIGQIFASLTLPSLRRLLLSSDTYPELIEWPHAQLLALCERSNLGRCLKVLQIAEVRITETELMEILSMLPALEHLEVGDAAGSVGDDDSSEAVLITDSFLRSMSCPPAPADCLVPRLFYLACVSRLAFTHSLLADFVTSRLEHLSKADSSIIFHVYLDPFPGSDLRLIPAVRTTLRELAIAHRRFVYQTGKEFIAYQRRL
ncbi:hypothetical protein DFH06DRAFT_1081466 [Mycena polygramma]|nr:hypothetical protein DFH06DRAFT_1081466 [Mycena polygramma]